MKVYLAARYGRRLELLEYARQLETCGIEVSSRWIHVAAQSEEEAFRHRAPLMRAVDDIEDVATAAVLVLFSERQGEAVPGAERGGRHVEFGVALAYGLRCLVVGPRENVFHHLPEVEVFAAWEEAKHVLIGGADTPNTEVASSGHENRD